MNYIRELNAFRDWLLMNELPTSEIVLWHTLMSVNNACGWQSPFSVANSRIQHLTGLSKQGLDTARSNLKLKGFIDYEKGQKKKPGRYRMLSLVKSLDPLVDQRLDLSLDLSLDQSIDQNLTITKQKQKPKQTDRGGDMGQIARAFERIFRHLPNGVQQQDLIECMDKGLEIELLVSDMEIAARGNKPFSYALKIMKNQAETGIQTLAQYQAVEAQRQQTRSITYEIKGGGRRGNDRTGTEQDDTWTRAEEGFFVK